MVSPRVSALLEQTRLHRGRLIIAIDATASRQPMWDLTAQLTGDLFEQAARQGGILTQLVSYRGHGEFSHSPWITQAPELIAEMGKVRCVAGMTQIARVLAHIREEHARQRIHAAVLITDAVEEPPESLYAAAAELNDVPIFCFQEGDNLVACFDDRGELITDHSRLTVEAVFKQIAKLTNGAWARFDAGAATKLAELLRAVAAFAAGGMNSLANMHTESARKLIGQMGNER